MSHTDQVQLFIADMRSRGLSAWTVAPPIYRVLWAIGFEFPPPFFAGFRQLAVSFGTFFGVFWGAFMWLFGWRETGMPPVVMLTSSAVTGVLFGLFMAWWTRRAARKLDLPEWHEYLKDHDGDQSPAPDEPL